jgi:2-dehydropantoate 2-reductase
MRIAIFGSGAVGGYFGGRLAQAGGDVVFIARGPQLVALQARGLHIESPLGDVHLPAVQATGDPMSIGAVDLVIFTVKLYDTDAAIQHVAPLIGPETLVVPLQNGVDSIEMLTRAFGRSHVAGGTTYVVSVLREPGVIQHTAMDRMIFGPVYGPPPPALQELRDLGQRAGFDAVLSDRIVVDIWAKFVRLSVFSSITSVARCPIGPIRSDPALRELMQTAWHESILVARGRQIPLPSSTYADIEAATAALPPGARSSMLEDLERGRRLELPWLSGAVVRIAEQVGVDAPTHRLFVALLGPHVNGRATT